MFGVSSALPLICNMANDSLFPLILAAAVGIKGEKVLNTEVRTPENFKMEEVDFHVSDDLQRAGAAC